MGGDKCLCVFCSINFFAVVVVDGVYYFAHKHFGVVPAV